MYILNHQFARKIMDSPQHKLYTKFAKFKKKNYTIYSAKLAEKFATMPKKYLVNRERQMYIHTHTRIRLKYNINKHTHIYVRKK